MHRNVTAIYRTHAVADLVRRELEEAGVSGSAIRIVPDRDVAVGADGYREDHRYSDDLHDLNLPEDDLRTYQHSVRNGDYVVSADVDDDLVPRTREIMRRPEAEARDLTARHEEYRDEAVVPRSTAAGTTGRPELAWERDPADEDPYLRSYRRDDSSRPA